MKQKTGITFSMRLKIILTFLLLGIVVSGFLATTSYVILDRSLFRQLAERVGGLARIAARAVDAGAVARLREQLVGEPDETAARAVESSADFRAVSDELNAVREVGGTLVRFIYLFVPTDDPNAARFLVDADLLRDQARAAAGEAVDEESLTHFGSTFDVSPFPVARRALAEGVPLVESAYSYDEEFGVNSLTGYAPVRGADGGLAAVVGIDMVDTDVRTVLSGATTLSFVVMGVTLVLTVLASVIMGTLFTRGIVSLDQVVRRFDMQHLDVRAAVRSRDEVGRLGHSFNAMADTIQGYSSQLEKLLSAYGRFVPREFLKLLGKDSIVDVHLGDQIQRAMTVLFADIRGFTSLSEAMTPKENFNFLNSYLHRMGPEIRSCGGFIDKYIGDGIMALFPERPDDGLAAAVAMQRKIVEYNVHRARSGYAPIAVGAGVHTGSLMLGTIGESERMDGTVISDAVNLCSRLQGLTRHYGATVLATGSTLRSLAEPNRFRFRFIDRVRVVGRRDTVLVFECLDGDAEEQRERKLSYRADLAKALRHYFNRRFREALELIVPLSRANADDGVLHLYRRRCDRLLRKGVPPGWDGAEVIDGK